MFKLKDTLNGLDTKAAKITKIVSNITLSLQKKGMEPAEIRSNLSKYVTAAKKLVTDTSADISDKAFKKSLKELEKFVGVKVNEDLDIMQDIDELEKQKKQPWFRGSRQSGKNKVINKQIADLQTAAETKSIDDLVSKYANPGDVKGSNSDDLKTAQKLLDENKGGIFSSKKKKANRKKAESIQEGFDKAARLQNKTSFKGVDPKTDEQVRMQRVFDALPGELKERAYDFAGDMKEAKANAVKQVMQQGKLTLSDIERKYKGYADGTDDVNSREFEQNIDEPTYLRQERATKGKGESANRTLGKLYNEAKNIKNMKGGKAGEFAARVKDQLFQIGENFRENVYDQEHKVEQARAAQNKLEQVLKDAEVAEKKAATAQADKDAKLKGDQAKIRTTHSDAKRKLTNATKKLNTLGINLDSIAEIYNAEKSGTGKKSPEFEAVRNYIMAKGNATKPQKAFDELKEWEKQNPPPKKPKVKSIDSINEAIDDALRRDQHPKQGKNDLYDARIAATELDKRLTNLYEDRDKLLKTDGHYPSDIEAIEDEISRTEKSLDDVKTQTVNAAKNPDLVAFTTEKVEKEKAKQASIDAEEELIKTQKAAGREAAVKAKSFTAGGVGVVGETISDTADAMRRKAIDAYIQAGASTEEAVAAAKKFADKNLTGDSGNEFLDKAVQTYKDSVDKLKVAGGVGSLYKDEAGNWAKRTATSAADSVDEWAESAAGTKTTSEKLGEAFDSDKSKPTKPKDAPWSELNEKAMVEGLSRQDYITKLNDNTEAKRLLDDHFEVFKDVDPDTDDNILKDHLAKANSDLGTPGTSSTGMDEDINQQDIDSKLNRNLGESGVDVGQSSTDTPDEPPGNDGPDGKNDKGWIRRSGEYVVKAPIRAAGAVAGTAADITKDVAGGAYDTVKGGAKLGGKVFGPAAVGEGFGLISDTLRGAKNYYDTPAGEESDQYLRDRADDAFRIMESIPGALKLSYDDYSTMLDQGEYGAIAGRLGLAAQDAMQSGFKGATNAAYSLYDAIDAITRGEGEEDGFVYEDYKLGKDRGWTNQAKYDTGVDPLEYHPSQQSAQTKALLSKVTGPGLEGTEQDPKVSQQQDKQVARQQQAQAKAHAASPMGRAQNWADKYDDVGLQGLYQSNGYQRPVYKSTTPGVASFGDTPMQVAGGGMGQYDYNAAEAQTEANVLQGYKDIRAKAEEAAKPYYLKGMPTEEIASLTLKEKSKMKMDFDQNQANIVKSNAKANELSLSMMQQGLDIAANEKLSLGQKSMLAKNMKGRGNTQGASAIDTPNRGEIQDKYSGGFMGLSNWNPIGQYFGDQHSSLSDSVDWNAKDRQDIADGLARYDQGTHELRTTTGRNLVVNDADEQLAMTNTYGSTGPVAGETPDEALARAQFNANYQTQRFPVENQ
ncbi:MAG: hypothetical protein DRQ39_03665 [Gammaproteobacteria bacterium]|nr:MAG: hypothetical protein DRQ39_03665 [Gammaproteobacteria bacterium]